MVSRRQERKWYTLITRLGERALLAAILLLMGLFLIGILGLRQQTFTYQLEGKPVGPAASVSTAGEPMVSLEVNGCPDSGRVYLALGDSLREYQQGFCISGYGELWLFNLSHQAVNVTIIRSQRFLHKLQEVTVPPGAKLLGVLGRR